jgi:hypothetical protein
MGKLIDFQEYKNRKETADVEAVFSPPPIRHEGYCPFCQAPTLIKLTMAGTPIHTFDPNNMEQYQKLRELMIIVVDYFRQQDADVTDDALIEAFGEGMAEFLRELEQERGH